MLICFVIGSDCRVFDEDTCLKGKFVKENGQLMCKHYGSVTVLILLYASIISIILSIIFLILNFTSKHKKNKTKCLKYLVLI